MDSDRTCAKLDVPWLPSGPLLICHPVSLRSNIRYRWIVRCGLILFRSTKAVSRIGLTFLMATHANNVSAGFSTKSRGLYYHHILFHLLYLVADQSPTLPFQLSMQSEMQYEKALMAHCQFSCVLTMTFQFEGKGGQDISWSLTTTHMWAYHIPTTKLSNLETCH